MSLGLASIPIAWAAGMLGIVSPCVWPLVPVVASAAGAGGRGGLWFLALGLSTAFAIAGTLVVYLLLNLGLDPEFFRYIAAVALLFVGLTMLVDRVGQAMMSALSRLVGRFGPRQSGVPVGAVGQFGVGFLLGFVWLPCVGPTLGAAITLASLGQDMMMAAIVMFSFGAGTASVLVFAGVASRQVLARLRPSLLAGAGRGKHVLAMCLVILGVLALTGFDRRLEAWSLRWLPEWVVGL